MASELMNILMRERLAELDEERARERATLAAREAEREAAMAQTLVDAVEGVIAARFPAAPLSMAASLHLIRDPQVLRDLLHIALRASDLETVQSAVEAAVPTE